MPAPREPRGFTLIEVLISVAIIGLLASMAIPSFQRFVLRAKVVERRPTMLHIAQGVQDYYTRNGAVVPGGGIVDSGFNPPLPPVPGKRPMLATLPAWTTYSASGPVTIEGGVYYSYRFVIEDAPELGRVTVWAAGDLDSDGVISFKQMTFTRVGGGPYLLTSEFPPPGQEDDSGPYQTF